VSPLTVSGHVGFRLKSIITFYTIVLHIFLIALMYSGMEIIISSIAVYGFSVEETAVYAGLGSYPMVVLILLLAVTETHKLGHYVEDWNTFQVSS